MFRRKNTLIAILAVALVLPLLATAGISLFLWAQKTSWEMTTYPLAAHFGSTRASKDFKEGTLRLYQIDGKQHRPAFTGTYDGPFEVWNYQFYPSLGHPHMYATETEIKFYNMRMRQLHSEMQSQESTTTEPSPVEHN